MTHKIHISAEDREYVLSLFDNVLNSSVWSEGKYVNMFEEAFGAYVEAEIVATNSWSGAAMAVLEYVGVKGSVVLVPSNTFMATPLAAIKAGARVEFVDCNRYDLCMSAKDLEAKIDKFNPRVVILVHIGGHIAFDIHEIVALCERNRIILIEDCAHAHGANFNGKKAGTFGLAGMYSFYATKTMTTGEGGCVVSKDKDLIAYARKYINYGKFEYAVQGLNYRMSEFNAALGVWQTKKLPEIIWWKNKKAQSYDREYKNHLRLPQGMTSGYYKYVVFEPIVNSTGKVYDQPCHQIMRKEYGLPNSDWVAKNHWCVPIYYKRDDSHE